MLVGNSVNLMNSIGELIKDAQVAAVESRTTDGGEEAEGQRKGSEGLDQRW